MKKILSASLATKVTHTYLGNLKVADIKEDDEVIPLKQVLKYCVISIPRTELKYMKEELISCMEIAKDTLDSASNQQIEEDAANRITMLSIILQRLK